jgi:PAS domain S-box-containing protein
MGMDDGTAPPRRVLLVHSFGRDFAPFTQVVEGFRAELSRVGPQPVEFYETSLEMARFHGIDREEPLVVYLESVFGGRGPDLVVPFGAPAVHFCHRNRSRLFPGVPVLAAGADKRRITGMEDDPQLTSVHFELDLPGIAAGIRRLVPELRHLYVVMGVAPVERYWENQLRQEWPPVFPGVEIHWLSDKSLAEIRRELAGVPAGSAVFHGIMTRDASGVAHEYENALTAVCQTSGAPVFGYSEEQLGAGIVGGSLVSMRECGRTAAGVAVRLLAGEDPAGISIPPLQPGAPKYDGRELIHWDIPVSRLPPGSSILYRTPGLWESHRSIVLFAIAALVLQSVLIFLLVAARRRARESGDSLRLATEAAGVGLWSHETGGNDEIQASPEWRALFGLPAKGPLRTGDVLARIHPEDRMMVRESMEHTFGHRRDDEIEHRIVREDGGVRWIASRGRAEAASGGRKARIRGASIDITVRKRTEAELAARREELAHLTRAASLGELSGALAHELNQPLGSILSNAQTALRLLARGNENPSEIREILHDIVAEDQRAASVITRLRALLERGEISPQPLDFHECVETVLALLATDLKQRGVVIERRFASQAPLVHADPIQLQQVLLNLLGNACDATATHPHGERMVTLRSTVADGRLVVEIQDNGSGFRGDPEDCFRPFHTTKPKGLGMGLAICQSVIEAHRGTISAASLAGGGALVRFTLPAIPPP